MDRGNNNTVPTRRELDGILSANIAADHKGWAIYRYLKANVGQTTTDSLDCRRLLSAYLELPPQRPSLLHSLMLGVATRMADAYPDFRLSRFVDIWDMRNMRADDHQRQTDKQGRTYHSLAERLTACVLRRMVADPTEQFGNAVMAVVADQAPRLGYLPVTHMVAVKMFESEHQGRKVRMVKLVGPQGEELSCDWRPFHAKPWEIVGRMYRVLPRRSHSSDNVRVDAIGPAVSGVADQFGRVMGYVDSYDDKHKHYHIYDNTSRHFVAESPVVRPRVGDYVWFAPIVPAGDPFKSAVVIAIENQDAGREAFGAVHAQIDYVNTDKGSLGYTTSDGQHGYGNLKAARRPIAAGQTVRMTVFLRRGRDGRKRPYAADIY